VNLSTTLAVLADDEVVQVHPGDDLVQGLRGRGARVGFVAAKGGDQPGPGLEEPLRQGLLALALRTGQVLAEVLEVAAEV
jgi:hypothetical protein